MKKLLLCTFIALILLPFAAFAQKNKIKKLVAASRYQEAATLYQKIIQTDSSTSNISGLANCLFQLRKYEEADALYSSLWSKELLNPTHLKKAAQTKWLLGDRQTAEDMLKIYLTEREDQEATLMLQNLEIAENIPAKFPEAQVEIFAHNSEADDNTPFFDGKNLYFTSDRPVGGINPLRKKNSTTGRAFFQVYKSSFSKDGFEKPVLVGNEVNALNVNLGGLVIHKNRAIFSRNSLHTDRYGNFNMQLYEINLDEPFGHKTPKKLSFCKEEKNYMHPSLSPDGNTILFATDKAGGAGAIDIFYAVRSKGKWSSPKPIEAINTPLNEGFPFLDAENNLYFASNGLAGFGGYDIFIARYNGDTWEVPENVGAPINSVKDDFGFVLVGQQGVFSSDRAADNDDLYQVEIPSKEDPLEDYNQLRGDFYDEPDFTQDENKNSGIAFRYFKK